MLVFSTRPEAGATARTARVEYGLDASRTAKGRSSPGPFAARIGAIVSRLMTRRVRRVAIALLAAGAIESVALRSWILPRVLAFSHGATYLDQGNVVRQRTHLDCGVAALAMILAHHSRGENSTYGARREYALESLRELTQRRQRGLSFAELQNAAAAYALSAQGWILPASRLRTIAMPAIVHFPNHYVVLDSIRQRSAYLRDPAIGRVRMTLAMLARRSTGRVLVFCVNSTQAERDRQ